MSTKIYVLTEATESSANVYVQPNPNERIRLKKRPLDHAYGQITFTDRDGKQKTIRYKQSCNEIDFHKQIKEFMIPANEKFAQAERDDLRFVDGVLATDKEVLQNYLETSPEFEEFWKKDKNGKVGSCSHVRVPKYRLMDKAKDMDDEDAAFRKRLKAANKIAEIKDLKTAQELMIRLNGSFFKTPVTLKACTSDLIRFLDSADDAMLDALLKDELNLDEEVTVLIGKAINLGILSFDKVPNQVVKIKGENVVKLKEISSEYLPEERKRYFSEFLTSADGKLLVEDLKKEIAGIEGEDKE